MISTGGEGKISARKRLRGKIGDPNRSPELKMFNLMSDPDNHQPYRSLKMYGVYAKDEDNWYGVWKPLVCNWPALGVGVDGRIGKKIRIKYLRIKGYVAAAPFLITQVRYRIVLYRVRINLVDGVETYDQNWLASLYNNYKNMEIPNPTSSITARYAVENYYMSYFNKDELKAKDCKRRVLLTGILKPSEDIGNYTLPAEVDGYVRSQPVAALNVDTITGNAQGTIVRGAQYAYGVTKNIPLSGEFQRHNTVTDIPTEVNSKSFFPIDLTVSMNDNIDCYEYRYVFVIESDWSVGQNEDGFYSSAASYANYFFKIVPQIYYFDD